MDITIGNLAKNRFVEKLRVSNIYDDNEYKNLIDVLKELSTFMKGKEKIPKKLAEQLFSLNDNLIGYINICVNINDKFGFKHKVIDAWSEVNELIVECLCD